MRTVSICIPTCDRVGLLKEAVESCLAQTRLPEEIVIGDDSKSSDTEQFVSGLTSPIPIRYKRNAPRLGQADNVNSIYQRVGSSHLILLHDDDLLHPNAVDDLSSCWDIHPNITAAYGKQHIATDNGTIVESRSQILNKMFCRTPDRAGLQPRSWEAGMIRQFPNDGYMLDANAARAIPCSKQAGDGVDFDFGLRLSLAYDQFFFLDKYTSIYRITEYSISSAARSNTALQGYRLLKSAELPAEAAVLRHQEMSKMAPVAIMQAVRNGSKQEAWAIYRSPHHGLRKRFSLGGAHRLLRMLVA